jgi:predicted GNAT family acetyltransferase
MDDKFYVVSFLKKLFVQNNDEKWTRKVEEYTKKIKFDNIEKTKYNLEIKQLNYDGDIYYLLFNKEIFIGFTQIRFADDKIWVDIAKVTNKLKGKGYGTILSNHIINIGKQNKQFKEIISQPDGVENGKEFIVKQGFENKGDLMVLNIN